MGFPFAFWSRQALATGTAWAGLYSIHHHHSVVHLFFSLAVHHECANARGSAPRETTLRNGPPSTQESHGTEKLIRDANGRRSTKEGTRINKQQTSSARRSTIEGTKEGTKEGRNTKQGANEGTKDEGTETQPKTHPTEQKIVAVVQRQKAAPRDTREGRPTADSRQHSHDSRRRVERRRAPPSAEMQLMPHGVASSERHEWHLVVGSK